MRPGNSIEEILLRWPDGSAFKMQFYASPRWWEGKEPGRAGAFYRAVHDLIREGFDEDEPMAKQPYELSISERDGVKVVAHGEDLDVSPQTVLRMVADLIDNGSI